MPEPLQRRTWGGRNRGLSQAPCSGTTRHGVYPTRFVLFQPHEMPWRSWKGGHPVKELAFQKRFGGRASKGVSAYVHNLRINDAG